MYKTGDLVMLDEYGDYLFLGRRDSQIKSRGYRIELGEIESALLSHPGVREAAALAIPDEEIGARIKAVVAPHEPGSLTMVDLQKHCAARIPSYMIPEMIELRDVLPKTSTGKIDRVSLTSAAPAA
jgi:acyl-coenzyme A synthetase/AMP-(fatty) acid ligase